jgi:hypothetical protein
MGMTKKAAVYIVHHIDTEGPLSESIEELFIRLKDIFNIELEPTEQNLRKLQKRAINLDGIENEVSNVVSPHLINFKSSWEQIDEMLNRIMHYSFRDQLLDSAGNGWIYNWHVMDHVGYKNNPRKRDVGYGNIFKFYNDKIMETNSNKDAIHWHFHPVNLFLDGHIPATSYNNSMYLLQQIINRRIIEHNYFPVVNRAGFHSERPDSHLFLEQWVPFDASNQSVAIKSHSVHQSDGVDGRFGDWKGAPDDWSIYNPHHDNYKRKGACRRYIARVLNLNSRFHSINETEIEKAFQRVKHGKSTYLGITNHDWREMSTEIDHFRNMLKIITNKYPEVPFYFSESVNAFRNILFNDTKWKKDKLIFDVTIRKKSQQNAQLLVNLRNGSFFGQQPWLVIKMGDTYFTDNFDVITPDSIFSYTFDNYTIKIQDVEIVAVASNDKYGNQQITELNADKNY